MEKLIRLIQKATLIGDFGPKTIQNGSNERETEVEDDQEHPDLVLSLGSPPGYWDPVGSSPPSYSTEVPPPPSPPPPYSMGQKPSALCPGKPKISLTWALSNDITLLPNNKHLMNSEVFRKQNNMKREIRARSISPASTDSSPTRAARRRRPRRARPQTNAKNENRFGYQIQDVDEFLSHASLDCPGNIPMVLSTTCVLYQTQIGGPQNEVSLPLGMVVNGVLKNRAWLYVQTPHGQEGYVPYACCIPLGILPPPTRPRPCWDTQTDIFPRPVGNRTDTQKMRDGTRSESGVRTHSSQLVRTRPRKDSAGEKSVDGLYLQAARKTTKRQTLLVIGSDYTSPGRNALSVCKGDVVSLVSSHLRDWFWVRDRDGREGFIPAVVAGHGFL